MSIYTERLKKIASFSAKIDRAAVNESDFVELQRLADKIIDDYNSRYYSMQQRNVLRSAVNILIDECRGVLRVNAEVKEISRSIRKQKLAERGLSA